MSEKRIPCPSDARIRCSLPTTPGKFAPCSLEPGHKGLCCHDHKAALHGVPPTDCGHAPKCSTAVECALSKGEHPPDPRTKEPSPVEAEDPIAPSERAPLSPGSDLRQCKHVPVGHRKCPECLASQTKEGLPKCRDGKGHGPWLLHFTGAAGLTLSEKECERCGYRTPIPRTNEARIPKPETQVVRSTCDECECRPASICTDCHAENTEAALITAGLIQRPETPKVSADDIEHRTIAAVVAWLRTTPRAGGVLVSVASSQDIARIADELVRGAWRRAMATGGTEDV